MKALRPASSTFRNRLDKGVLRPDLVGPGLSGGALPLPGPPDQLRLATITVFVPLDVIRVCSDWAASRLDHGPSSTR